LLRASLLQREVRTCSRSERGSTGHKHAITRAAQEGGCGTSAVGRAVGVPGGPITTLGGWGCILSQEKQPAAIAKAMTPRIASAGRRFRSIGQSLTRLRFVVNLNRALMDRRKTPIRPALRFGLI